VVTVARCARAKHASTSITAPIRSMTCSITSGVGTSSPQARPTSQTQQHVTNGSGPGQERVVAGVRPLWPDFRRTATTDWLGPLAGGLRSIGREHLATLVLAVIRGLLMDLDATADRSRTDQAFHHFLDSLDR
jgi:hypothetical protein